MPDENKILVGSFKEVPIRILSGTVDGGRKFVKKEFPNRDTQTVEDLGLQPRSYKLEILIADIGKTAASLEPRQGYFEYRNTLIAAIENRGTGILIHPFYGRIENIIATTYSINENFTTFGRSTLSVTFETSNDTGIPVQSTTALSQIDQFRATVDAAVSKDITDNFSVLTKFTNNFRDAQNKILEIVDSAVEATSFIGAVSDEINNFNSFIGQLSASVNSLIVAPNNLALSISNLFNNINGLFGTVENTAKAFQNLFGFGVNEEFSDGETIRVSDEDNVIPTTAGRSQRKQNRAVLNRAMNAQALSYAYVSVAQISFETVDEIEEAEMELEVQYKEIIDNQISDAVVTIKGLDVEATNIDSSQAVNDALTNMRVVVQTFFDEQRVSAKQVISVFTPITSARLLSYQYYAESESAEDIIALNNIKDVSFVEGDVEILTA